jgi:hypothetical protein
LIRRTVTSLGSLCVQRQWDAAYLPEILHATTGRWRDRSLIGVPAVPDLRCRDLSSASPRTQRICCRRTACIGWNPPQTLADLELAAGRKPFTPLAGSVVSDLYAVPSQRGIMSIYNIRRQVISHLPFFFFCSLIDALVGVLLPSKAYLRSSYEQASDWFAATSQSEPF